MTRLSVNINKVALLRNSRGGSLPNLRQFAIDCQSYGAQGITVHPRPDQRHIRYDDLYVLKEVVTTEFNIEGYPSEDFLKIVCEIKPHQCTLVPDPPGVLTSTSGWNTLKHGDFLCDVVAQLQEAGIRTSIFMDANLSMIEGLTTTHVDRIELYTGDYAVECQDGRADEILKNHIAASRLARELRIGVNAGHDLNLQNLALYRSAIQNLEEVSIGHALISDSLYFGIQNAIGLYRKCLK